MAVLTAKLAVIAQLIALAIEIIAPKQDMTLTTEKYDVLDNRIMGTVIGLLSAVVTLASFVTILWGLSGSISFTVAGHDGL